MSLSVINKGKNSRPPLPAGLKKTHKPSESKEIKKIAFIYTGLQKSIFNAITMEENIDFLILYPYHRKEIPDNTRNYIPIKTSDQKITIKTARELIKEINQKIEEKTSNSPFELWLASCDNPIGQILINHHNCRKTTLIEDGIGSYISHSFLDIEKGFRAAARKIKYWVTLFPHYRSVYGIGSHKADDYWAIHNTAFPRANTAPHTVQTNNLKKAFPPPPPPLKANKNTAIYLDQPLIRNNIASKDEIFTAIESHIKQLENECNIKNYIIKKHPVSSRQEIEEIIAIFSAITTAKIELIETNTTIESLSIPEEFSPAEVFSFISSALYTIKSIRPDIKIQSIIHKKSITKNPVIKKYIEAMQEIGITSKIYGQDD